MVAENPQDQKRWAYMTQGLGTKDPESEGRDCLLMSIGAAVIGALFVGAALGKTWLTDETRLLLALITFIAILLTARSSCVARWEQKKPATPAKPAPAPRAPSPAPAPAPAAPPAAAPAATVVGTRPEALTAARDGKGDDLTKIKGVGPKLSELCNSLGFYHFDQIAAWTADEVAWVDENLEGFKGRVSRDDWVAQAKILAAGGETEFSARHEGS